MEYSSLKDRFHKASFPEYWKCNETGTMELPHRM